jgi:hypothetical protein
MRGQAHTLEATIASLLMLSAVIFAIQMTAVTPLSASTSSQHIENQQRATASGVLASAASEDALGPAVLYWDASNEKFHNGEDSQPYYSGGSDEPDNRFGDMLRSAFGDSGIAYNVYFRFGDNPDRVQYIYSGTPSDNAASARRTVVTVDVREPVRSYVTRLASFTREHAQLGVSPRGGIALVRAAQARAVLDGRDYVVPDDVQQESHTVWGHRIRPGGGEEDGAAVVERALDTVPVE